MEWLVDKDTQYLETLDTNYNYLLQRILNNLLTGTVFDEELCSGIDKWPLRYTDN